MSWSSNLFIKIIGIWFVVLGIVHFCDVREVKADEPKTCFQGAYTMEKVVEVADSLMPKYGRYWSKVVASADGNYATMFFIWEKYPTAAVQTFVDGCLYAIDDKQNRNTMALLIAHKPLELLFPAEGIEFIYYDQLGCGNSDNPNDTSMWDLPRFVEEVEQVRIALNLNKDNFYLLGHSWGGILGIEYALKYQQNLKALIISNMMSSCPEYGKYADDVLAKQMPPAVLDSIRMIEAKGDFSNPRYMALLMPHFYAQHICRFPVGQFPDPVNRALNKINQSLYVTMQGPSEFGIAGKLEKWDRTADLKNIQVPTLTIGGKYDTMDPAYMELMSKQLPKGSYLYCANGSHFSMYDDQQTYMKGLIQFIKSVE